MNDLQAYLNSYPVVMGKNCLVIPLGSIKEVRPYCYDSTYNVTLITDSKEYKLNETRPTDVLEQWKEAFNIAMNNWFAQGENK